MARYIDSGVHQCDLLQSCCGTKALWIGCLSYLFGRCISQFNAGINNKRQSFLLSRRRRGGGGLVLSRAQHFPSNLYPYSNHNHNHQHQFMPTHSMTRAHLCPPMLFKLRPCIQKLWNVYYPSTPSLGWIGQIKSRSLSLASVRSASWLAYSEKFDSDLELDTWMHKTYSHPCPP